MIAIGFLILGFILIAMVCNDDKENSIEERGKDRDERRNIMFQ